MNKDLRWKQRFQNYEKAFEILKRRLDEYEYYPDMEAYQMALVQAFEITQELSWKLLKDYLESKGLRVATPKDVMRQAFQSEIIQDGEIWLTSIEKRNITSHLYHQRILKEILTFIQDDFYPVVRTLYHKLKQEQ